MLLELYVGIMAINFIIFGIAFFRKNVWMWAITLVLTALLTFASFNIEQNTAVVSSQLAIGSNVTYTYDTLTEANSDTSLFILHLGMFLLALALFLNDLFMTYKNGTLAEREY